MNFPKRIRPPPDAYDRLGRTFHVTIRALAETAPFRHAALAHDTWNTVLHQTDRGQVLVLAACLMPDHLHIVVVVIDGDLPQWVASFKQFTTRQSWRHGRHGSLWQPSFHDRAIHEGEAEDVVTYVCYNPVEAGLVAVPEDWPWLGVWRDG